MQRSIAVIGVPMDLGAGRRGVDMGPSAIRSAGLKARLQALGHRVSDLGDMSVPVPEAHEPDNPHLKYVREVAPACRELSRTVARTLQEERFPLVLGGDHSIAIGTLAGAAKKWPDVGVLWFDTHGDFNTAQTSPSGNIHGMPLATSVGRGAPELLAARDGAPPVAESRIVMIGVRELDAAERQALRDSQIRVFTMTEIDKLGMRRVMDEALEHLRGAAGVHVSFDMDVIDPGQAPGVGTPHEGGITYREAHLAMEVISDAQVMQSMDVVEVNPILDVANRTGRLAAELALSALGQRIL